MQTPPKVGVSACLLGHQVRYDGGHKRNPFLLEALDEHVEFIPVCPETAIGLGIPRPPIRLVGIPEHPRVIGVTDASLDVTGRLQDYAESEVSSYLRLSGFILKKDSPSCGMERVKVYDNTGSSATRKGVGAFARVLMQRLPLLPVEEEGRLNDAVLRENFIARIYVYQRWQHLLSSGLSAASLIEFHTAHKYQVMGHSQAAYQRLGRLISNLSAKPIEDLADEYVDELMSTLKRRVNRKRHVNVLQHIMGYLKKRIGKDDKVELTASIEAYRRGEVPLVVPVTLLRHYFRNHHDPYMEKQVYLSPYPESLGLRNAI
ncbi:MAG: DUF523 and DUF1722 domain-containing protein [Gammaproteobacteria bacterium]|nr:DUF523 and DUF1722 domain-containing protein [Gammaproteobacteria bacterium]